MQHGLSQSPDTGESGDAYNAERITLMASVEEVKGRQFNLMLDKALKHGRLMNHWLDKARKLMETTKGPGFKFSRLPTRVDLMTTLGPVESLGKKAKQE